MDECSKRHERDPPFSCCLLAQMCASLHSCASVHNLLLCACTHSFGSDRSDFLMGKPRERERAHSEPANHSRSRACWENRVYKYNVTQQTGEKRVGRSEEMIGRRKDTRL